MKKLPEKDDSVNQHYLNKIVLTNPDTDHQGLSYKTKVVYTPEKGRYLVAKENIQPGELVKF